MLLKHRIANLPSLEKGVIGYRRARMSRVSRFCFRVSAVIYDISQVVDC
jgi:hypothetical protein